jgi:cytidyltransferase-like protein|tara:strand:+ start:2068 stop:4128 length:2061 start_codon:yes stop_codon:yes gene_type:complete
MAKANTHLTHLEELVLTQGPEGYKKARTFLLELLKSLKGNTSSKIQTSVKWDGAPAIFAGTNPENGKFFVGTKSIFNKVPKINYTKDDIVKNHGHAPGLVDKLTKALQYLPALNIKNILQGDFMFDDEMISTANIDGEPHYKFKPNTIVYAVPVDSDLGRQIEQAKFGIVFHTTYDSLDSGASFGADISGLRRAPGVWFDDAFFTDDTGIVTLTDDEEAEIIRLVKEADDVNSQINYDDLPFSLLNIYINSEIKAGSFLDDPEKSFDGFNNWYSGRVQNKINKLKSDKGKQKATQNAQQTLQSFSQRKDDILNIFKVSRLLFEAKNIFIQKYNNAVYNTKHFVDDGSGDLVASNPEGYVAVDHRGNGIKFVDRLEFSRANFAVDKGDKFSGEINEQEDEFDIGDEDDDPVVDGDYPKTIAIVPGAFKPPHKGHLDMVRAYANIADEVIVLISKPTKSGRKLPNGREITAADSEAIWKILTAGVDNVDIRISPHASPLTAAYEYVGEDGPVNVGDKVALGCSNKGGDCKRWAGAAKYIKQGVELVPVTGVEPSKHSDEYVALLNSEREKQSELYNNMPSVKAGKDPEQFHASDLRFVLVEATKSDVARKMLEDFVGGGNVASVLNILGLESVSEISSMAGGAVAGYSAPLGYGSAKRPKKKKKTNEYMDLSLIDEVIELIMKRGITQ